ncbi:hypothetical protein KVV02_001763 [Mortierella alpina]|uniref:GATA-type domain-containing protein n=1 Tax=Mortierella alpina TaxID=64518 RepID=A0A9P7ZZ51_MORAP|nr:hypothetical protein KVV02_001763 [Mortierella alpina]
MFSAHATHCDTAATSAAAGAGDSNPWFHNDHLLLSPQDDLDYTSFSTDSPLPLLSLDSFSSTQPATAMTSFFPEFAPMSTPGVASGLFQGMSSFHSTVAPLPAKVPVNNSNSDDTARQAALLHAYLAVQNPPSSVQHQWTFPNSAVSNVQFQQQTYLVEQQQQQQKEMEEQQQEKEQVEQLMQTQQADALNLARYLAQSQQIKQEISSETAMEHDTVSAPQSPSPCSSSSESGDKSPMGSPTMTGRSLSPEAASPSKCSKPSRQLICFNCKVTQTPLWRRTPDRQHSLCNACGLYYKQYGAHRPLHVRHKLPTVLADARLTTLPYARPSSAQPTSPSERPLSFSSTSTESSSSSSSSSDSDSDSGRVVASLPDLAKMYTEALIRSPVQKTTPPLMTAKQGIECANCSQTQTPLWRKNDAGEPICNACGLYAKLHHCDRPVTMRKSKITRRRRDWGGNLAHQAQAQAQALALAHAQAQAQAQAQHQKGLQQQKEGGVVMDHPPLQHLHAAASSVDVATIVEEMNRKAQELVGHSTNTSAHSSDSEEEHPYKSFPSMQQQQQHHQEYQQQQQQQQVERAATPAPTVVATPPVLVGQNMSNSVILDENKFSDMVGQMNAHQMNRFLSILETRCGVLRERLLASTEATASDLDHLF